MPDDTYSNPLAPEHEDAILSPKGHHNKQQQKHPLKNEDFRKLLMTPRASGTSGHRLSTDSEQQSFTHRPSGAPVVDVGKPKRTLSTEKKAKKKAHVRTKKEEEDELAEIMKKYRDRAKERREGEDTNKGETDLLQLTAGYRAMGPDARSTLGITELRKQLIQESKYLGGDMEHTHLVKGLDYSLLQKVRSEIVSKEKEDDDLEEAFQSRKGDREEVESTIKSSLARSVYRLLFKDEQPKLNELFSPRRMAYVIELDDDYIESDIPTTLIRSKQDCPVDEATTNLSTHDMVIQKLTQVLSYLRTDTKRKKKDKVTGAPEKEIKTENQEKLAAQNIFDDAGDYVPETSKSNREISASWTKTKNYTDDRDRRVRDRRDRNRDHRRDDSWDRRDDSWDRQDDRRERDRRRGDRDRDRGRERDRRDRDRDRKDIKPKSEIDSRLAQGWSQADLSLQKQQEAGYNPKALTKEEKEKGMGSVFKRDDRDPLRTNTDKPNKKGVLMMGTAATTDTSYAECYPGGYEAFDAANDSDDDTDFSKMDMGNKKGPVRRWDFETEQEYEEYMSKREALPKAAFQYGVKMNEGRKTRKTGGRRSEKDEKQKIDRQWDQISRIISKRKDPDSGGADDAKKSKF